MGRGVKKEVTTFYILHSAFASDMAKFCNTCLNDQAQGSTQNKDTGLIPPFWEFDQFSQIFLVLLEIFWGILSSHKMVSIALNWPLVNIATLMSIWDPLYGIFPCTVTLLSLSSVGMCNVYRKPKDLWYEPVFSCSQIS